jgi:hypothetical protein
VPNTRELRIRCLASSLQRWSTGSPSRCTTPSQPDSASAGAGPVEGLAHLIEEMPSPSFSRARSGSRVSATTSSPRSSSSFTSAEPMVPVAPVTATLISMAS